jgi:hypothetical protein
VGFLVRCLVLTQILTPFPILVTEGMHLQAKQTIVNLPEYEDFQEARAVEGEACRRYQKSVLGYLRLERGCSE